MPDPKNILILVISFCSFFMYYGSICFFRSEILWKLILKMMMMMIIIIIDYCWMNRRINGLLCWPWQSAVHYGRPSLNKTKFPSHGKLQNGSTLGLSIGRFGLGLCPTRNWPNHFGFSMLRPAADRWAESIRVVGFSLGSNRSSVSFGLCEYLLDSTKSCQI